ncbi:hypothetical protein A7P96_05720 [Eikenella sp. NML03-A-027]|nr:hypothetical protein A7P96_05720 [Eikenella sp. NML03-A-027]
MMRRLEDEVLLQLVEKLMQGVMLRFLSGNRLLLMLHKLLQWVVKPRLLKIIISLLAISPRLPAKGRSWSARMQLRLLMMRPQSGVRQQQQNYAVRHSVVMRKLTVLIPPH